MLTLASSIVRDGAKMAISALAPFTRCRRSSWLSIAASRLPELVRLAPVVLRHDRAARASKNFRILSAIPSSRRILDAHDAGDHVAGDAHRQEAAIVPLSAPMDFLHR